MSPVLSGFTEPFYQGGSLSPLVPGVFPIAIGGHPYVHEPRESRRGFIPVQRETRDDSREPGEATINPEGMWRRSQSDWGLGAGQVWLDEDGSSRRRFDTSKGIDPWGDRELRLLPTTAEKRTSANTNLKLLTVGGFVYAMDGAALVFGDTPEAADWTGFTAATGLPGGALLDMCTTGTHVYVVASDNSIYRATIGTAAFALFFNPAAVVTRIWYALGRLIASDGRSLYEITAVPGETLIFTHPTVDFVWADVVGTPAGLYAAGNNADRGELRFTKMKTDGTGFEVPVVAAELPGETIRVLTQTGPLLIVGTTFGFRTAELNPLASGGSLLYGPAVTAPGDVRALVADVIEAETYVWFGWTNFDTTSTGLGRLRASRFTEPLVPAYASDVMATGQGAVISVVSTEGRRFFAVSGDGFYGTTTTLVASGTLNVGRIRYGMLDAKVFTDLTWRTDPLNGTVSFTATYDNGVAVGSVLHTTVSSTAPTGPSSLGNRSAEWVGLTVTLTRATDPTLGPVLRWWLARAIPAPQSTQRIVLALIMTEKVTVPSGIVRFQDVNAELVYLSGLITAQEIVRYQRGHISEDVYVVSMEERPDQWNSQSGCFEGLLLVEMLTR